MHGTVFYNRAAEATVSQEKHSRVKIRGAFAILHAVRFECVQKTQDDSPFASWSGTSCVT